MSSIVYKLYWNIYMFCACVCVRTYACACRWVHLDTYIIQNFLCMCLFIYSMLPTHKWTQRINNLKEHLIHIHTYVCTYMCMLIYEYRYIRCIKWYIISLLICKFSDDLSFLYLLDEIFSQYLCYRKKYIMRFSMSPHWK